MEKSLLQQLEQAVADLRQRAEESAAAVRVNRAQRAAALVAYDKATLSGDSAAQAQAEAEIKQLDAAFELLERQAETLARAVHSGEGRPREIARQIKSAREAELEATRQQAQAQAQQVEDLAKQFLAAVGKLGTLHRADGLARAAFEQAKPFLPESEREINSPLPHVNHQGRQGVPYLIDPQTIEAAFRNGFNQK